MDKKREVLVITHDVDGLGLKKGDEFEFYGEDADSYHVFLQSEDGGNLGKIPKRVTIST